MRPECIKAVSQALGRQITKAESDNIELKILEAQTQLWKKDRAGMIGLTKAQQFGRAAEEAAKYIKAEAALKKQRVALTLIAHDKVRTYLEPMPGVMLKNLQDILDGNKTMSVASATQAIRFQALAALADVSEKFMPKWLGFDQGNSRMEDVFRELHGKDSKNADAKAYATELNKVFDSLMTRFNEAGGKIGKLFDWSHPQAHSAYLVHKMGKGRWVEFIKPKLDINRYVNADGTLYSDSQFDAHLGSAWDILSYGGMVNMEPGQPHFQGARANAHSQHRELHFIGAEEYIAYHKLLGEKSLHATLVGHIDKMARDIALVETLGPNPQNEFNYWNDFAYQDGVIQGHQPNKLESTYIDNQRLYTEVAGVFTPVANQGAARFMDTMRSLNLIALGSSGISTITDLNTMMLTARFNHLPQLKMMVEHLRAYTDADSRRFARRLGIGLDTYAGTIMRHGQEQIANGVASKVGGAVIRLSGMPFITEANRQAFSITMMDALEHVVSNHATLADVDTTDYRMMGTHGIDEGDFALWKQAKPELWIDGESKLLTANAVMAIPGVDPVILRRSADKLMALVLDEQNMAVAQPSATDRAIMKAGTVRGTIMGELARSFWQFKSFGLAYFSQNLRRGLSMDSKQSAAAYAAQFVAQGLVLGVVATQLKELVNGRDPLKMADGKFAVKALLASGGLGLYGDFLFSQNTSFGTSPLETLAGPTLNKAVQLYNLTWGNVKKSAAGENIYPGAEALRLVNSYNPLSTVWFTKAAFNHMVLQNLQEMLSPGYLRRMQRRSEREFGQSFYWKPGEALPSRVPNLGRAIE